MSTLTVHTAAQNNQLHVLRTLVGENPNLVNSKDVVSSFDGHSRSCVGLMVKKDERSPLHWAAASGSTEIVRFLLDKDATVDVVDNSEWTPLHIAVSAGHEDIVQLLVGAGADVNKKTNKGMTPLHYAASKSRLDIAKLLIARGADINAKDRANQHPLHRAATIGSAPFVKLLVESGAPPNKTRLNTGDRMGNTPLHLAMDSAHAEAAVALISAGADRDRENVDGETPEGMEGVGGSEQRKAKAYVIEMFARAGTMSTLKERIAAIQQREEREKERSSGSVPTMPASVSAGAMRAKIAQFESQGAVPAPRGSFGLGAPPERGPRQRAEMYGNRMQPARVPSATLGLSRPIEPFSAPDPRAPIPPSVDDGETHDGSHVRRRLDSTTGTTKSAVPSRATSFSAALDIARKAEAEGKAKRRNSILMLQPQHTGGLTPQHTGGGLTPQHTGGSMVVPQYTGGSFAFTSPPLSPMVPFSPPRSPRTPVSPMLNPSALPSPSRSLTSPLTDKADEEPPEIEVETAPVEYQELVVPNDPKPAVPIIDVKQTTASTTVADNFQVLSTAPDPDGPPAEAISASDTPDDEAIPQPETIISAPPVPDLSGTSPDSTHEGFDMDAHLRDYALRQSSQSIPQDIIINDDDSFTAGGEEELEVDVYDESAPLGPLPNRLQTHNFRKHLSTITERSIEPSSPGWDSGFTVDNHEESGLGAGARALANHSFGEDAEVLGVDRSDAPSPSPYRLSGLTERTYSPSLRSEDERNSFDETGSLDEQAATTPTADCHTPTAPSAEPDLSNLPHDSSFRDSLLTSESGSQVVAFSRLSMLTTDSASPSHVTLAHRIPVAAEVERGVEVFVSGKEPHPPAEEAHRAAARTSSEGRSVPAARARPQTMFSQTTTNQRNHLAKVPKTPEKRHPLPATPLSPGYASGELAELLAEAAALEQRLEFGELFEEPAKRIAHPPPRSASLRATVPQQPTPPPPSVLKPQRSFRSALKQKPIIQVEESPLPLPPPSPAVSTTSSEVPPTPPPKSGSRYFSSLRRLASTSRTSPARASLSLSSELSSEDSVGLQTPPDDHFVQSSSASVYSVQSGINWPSRAGSVSSKKSVGGIASLAGKMFNRSRTKSNNSTLSTYEAPSPPPALPPMLPNLDLDEAPRPAHLVIDSDRALPHRPTSWLSVSSMGSSSVATSPLFDQTLFDAFPSVPEMTPSPQTASTLRPLPFSQSNA
ncbi:unnamed protein product [Mycena citricolor]|uniref:DUF1720 domain-containing protein n=1 Tax=Mycena citricolor TaxID=2018698 RepID=A0AAD2HNA4_9AGAR|nr:unnamed protein product [Mycena citricolor]